MLRTRRIRFRRCSSTCIACRRYSRFWRWRSRFVALGTAGESTDGESRDRVIGRSPAYPVPLLGRESARAEVRRHVGRGPDRIRAVAEHIVRTRRVRRRRRGRGLGHGQDHRRSRAPRPRGLERSLARERWTCSSPRESASRSRCCAWRSSTSARPRSVVHGLAGRHRHRHRAPQGEDPGDPQRPAPGGARGGQRRRGRRLPGRVDRTSDHHPRPGWLRHHGGGAGGRARGRRVRDLHRRVGRVHRRSTHRARRRAGSTGCRTTRCSRCRPRVDASSRCARSSSPATTGCPSTCDRASRGRRARGCEEEERGMEAPIISGVTHDSLGGEGHDLPRARPSRHRCQAVPCARRRERQRRHDRAERVDRRPHRHLVHGARATSCRAPSKIVDKIVVEIDAGGANFDDAIGRVSLVGAGMKTNPGVAAQMFETLAAEGVNIEMISTSTIRISCVVHENDVERAVQRAPRRRSSSRRSRRLRVGVVGATGLVGTEMLRLLDERAFPVSELRAYASPRSEGRRCRSGTARSCARSSCDGCFDGLDLVVIDVDDPLALEWAPQAVRERRRASSTSRPRSAWSPTSRSWSPR